MKKLFFIIPLVLLFSYILPAASYDSSTLTNKVSQNKCLADSFFLAFSGFVNELSFPEFEPEATNVVTKHFKFKTSLDAVYYTGFDINTDFGTQEGSLVQGYSDLLIGIKGKILTFAFGSAGSRYGVFLTDIDFKIPPKDPVKTITVNDFTGTQIMTDIYSAVFGIKNFIWFGGYFFTSANYSPDDSGILSLAKKDSSIDYWGIKGNISTIFNCDLLFNKEFTLQSLNWSFDALQATLFFLQRPLHYNYNLKAGMYWYTKQELASLFSTDVITRIDWKNFDIPLDFKYSINTFFSSFDMDGGIHFAISDTFKSFYIGEIYAGIAADRLISQEYKGKTRYYRAGIILKASYYENEKLKLHGKSDSPFVFGIQAGITFSPGKTNDAYITGSWRYNYVEDLKNLVESKDKHVFTVYATYNL